MASKLFHATIDLIAYGRAYFSVHEKKDAAARRLGRHHRRVNHPWYQRYGVDWTIDKPFPAHAQKIVTSIRSVEGKERFMSAIGHDHMDRLWDELDKDERIYWEAFCVWLLDRPDLLRTWAGADVREGRIHRVVNGQELWEPCPELAREYLRLRAYARAVAGRNPRIREFLRGYGDAGAASEIHEWDEFVRLIEEVDRKLSDSKDPFTRPTSACLSGDGRDYSGPILGAGIDPRAYPEYEAPNLLSKIGDWFVARYGGRNDIPTLLPRPEATMTTSEARIAHRRLLKLLQPGVFYPPGLRERLQISRRIFSLDWDPTEYRIIQEVSRREELEVIVPNVHQNPDPYLKDVRPPLLKDYFDPKLRKLVRLARRLRQVRISFGAEQADVQAG